MLQVLRDIFDFFPKRRTKLRALRFFRKKVTFEERLKKIVDKGIYFVSIVSPMMTLPQIIDIYTTGNIAGLSIFTWASYFLLTFVWLAYGIIHKDKPIIITQVLWMLMYGIVTVQIIFYASF